MVELTAVVATPPEWDEWLRPLVVRRFDSRCACCGTPFHSRQHVHVHHRILKGQTRIDRPDNLVALLDTCHRRWHDHDRAGAEERGIIVPSWADPREVPLTLWSGRRVWLDEYGNALPRPPEHECRWERVTPDDGPPCLVCVGCGLVRDITP